MAWTCPDPPGARPWAGSCVGSATALAPPLRRGVRGEAAPPGLLATRLARGLVVLRGRDARLSGANVRRPAAAQVPTAQPFVLDGLPGIPPRWPRSVAGRGRAFGACCFAGKLRSPGGPGPGATVAEAVDPYASGYASPYASPYAGHPRTPPVPRARICPGYAPSWG
jgi:hypothetical protein